MKPEICLHGFFLEQCAICHKEPGQCDYGSCEEMTVGYHDVRRENGDLVQRRPMCGKHLHIAAHGYGNTGAVKGGKRAVSVA